MTSRVRSDLRVRPFEDAEEEELLALLRLALGPGPTGNRDLEFLRWKHLHNPFGRSFMLLAEADGRIVGLRAFLRWRFQIESRTLNAVRAVDTATHPDYRRKGIFSTLTTKAIDALRSEDVDLVFNTPNHRSLPGYLKMGWHLVGRIPVLVRMRRPLRVVRGLKSLTSNAISSYREPNIAAPSVTEALHDAAKVSELLENVRERPRGIATLRNIEYLRWRYAAAPGFDYRAVTEINDGQLSGIAVFRVRPRGSLWETMITELLTRPDDRPTLRRLLRRVAAAAPVDHVTLTGSGRTSQFVRSGFVPSPDGITLAVNPLNTELDLDPTVSESWNLSLGDVEAL